MSPSGQGMVTGSNLSLSTSQRNAPSVVWTGKEPAVKSPLVVKTTNLPFREMNGKSQSASPDWLFELASRVMLRTVSFSRSRKKISRKALVGRVRFLASEANTTKRPSPEIEGDQ